MKRLVALLPYLFLSVVLPIGAQRPGPGGGGHTTPRANQGHIPPPPVARSSPQVRREPERWGDGRANETPHVNHDRWYGHEPPNDSRFHQDHPFSHGRFGHVGPGYRYRILRIDPGRHWFWFPGGFYFEVANWDWPIFTDWCWNCGDDFVIYDDPDHIGWYLLYNIHTGMYVHVLRLGQ